MSVASRLAGWWLHRGVRLPAQTRASSMDTLNDGTPLMVEILVDGLWDNLTAQSLVLNRDRVNITRGQSGEGTKADAGRCAFGLKNHEDLGYPFSGGNPLSPYWGKVGQGTRVRVSVPDGFGKSYRFQGEMTALDEDSDISGKDASVSVTAAGILDRLGRNDQPVRSVLYRDITLPDLAQVRTTPKAYWSMEDASGAQSCASALGGAPMTFTSSPTLAAFSSFDCSDAIPNMSGSRFTGQVPSYTIDTNLNSASTIWFLLAADTAITTGTMLVRIVTGTTRWELVYTTGALSLDARSLQGTLLNSTGAINYTLVGQPTWVGIKLEDTHGGVEGYMMVEAAGSESLQVLGNANDGSTATPVKYVQFNPLEAVTDFFVGHCAVFFHRQDELNYADIYVTSQLVLGAFNGERADVRFNRLCREEQITREILDPLVAGVGVGQQMGPQKSGALLSLLRQCEATDGGIIYEMTTDFGIGYRTLASMTSQSSAVTLSQGNSELSEQPKPRRDNSKIKNDVTVSRIDGSSATVTDDAHITSVGRYPDAVSLSLHSDTQLPDQAGWAVHLGTVTEPRYERITVNLAHPSFTSGGTLRQNVLAVRPGDRVDIGDVPARLGYDDIIQLALGYSETIDHDQHTIAWNAAPESPYRVAEADSDTFGKADTDGSQLAADVTTTGTSLSVEITDGPLWVTDVGEFPFDIRVGGEVITVTAISGASSPQTFTATRSVNGVIKAHTTGADVRLDRPAIAAL